MIPIDFKNLRAAQSSHCQKTTKALKETRRACKWRENEGGQHGIKNKEVVKTRYFASTIKTTIRNKSLHTGVIWWNGVQNLHDRAWNSKMDWQHLSSGLIYSTN